jgi:hypothetical protein
LEQLRAAKSAVAAAPEAQKPGPEPTATPPISSSPQPKVEEPRPQVQPPPATPSLPPPPPAWQADLERAERELRAGNLNSAERAYRNVLESQPGNPAAARGLAQIRERRQKEILQARLNSARDALSRQDADAALRSLSDARGIDASAFEAAGGAALQAQAERLQTALKQKQAGVLAWSKGDRSRARSELEAASQVLAQDTDIRQILGKLRQERAEFDSQPPSSPAPQPVSAPQPAVPKLLVPQSPSGWSHFEAGFRAYYQGNYQQAIRALDQAQKAGLPRAEYLVYLACAHASLALMTTETQEAQSHRELAMNYFKKARPLGGDRLLDPQRISPSVIELLRGTP